MDTEHRRRDFSGCDAAAAKALMGCQELWAIPNGLAALGRSTQIYLKGGGQGTLGKIAT